MRFVFFLIYIVSAIIFSTPFISPISFWPAAFLTPLVLPVVVLHLLISTILLQGRQFKKAWPSLVFLLVGIPYMADAVGSPLSFIGQKEEGIAVLSYNVRVFNNYLDLNHNYKESIELLEWIRADDSDIKCLQEFYHNLSKPILQSKRILADSGRYFYCDFPFFKDAENHEFGLAIFSKHPIINCGRIAMLKTPTNNGAIFADILLSGQDTIRVVNMHLESLSFNTQAVEGRLLVEEQAIYLGKKLKTGFQKRATQVDILADFIRNTPYPVILCGDLNDLPYSYSYQAFSRILQNTHAQIGLGIGGSYNGLYNLLRIDHQFYSSEWKPNKFSILQEIGYTDHYPLKGWYGLKE